MTQEIKPIFDIVTLKDGLTAKDRHGNVYTIESITIGADYHRKTFPYEKSFLKEDSDCQAELLSNGKLNIIP